MLTLTSRVLAWVLGGMENGVRARELSAGVGLLNARSNQAGVNTGYGGNSYAHLGQKAAAAFSAI